MKTKLTLPRATLFLFANLLLPQAAQAFYNPSTGRWLSRDPVGEEAFFQIYTTSWTRRERQRARIETLKLGYVFLANDSIDSIDAFGLLRFDSKCSPSDIEKMKKELKDRCQKAKAGNCYRCLDQKYQTAMQKLCDEIDKNTGPMVVCEDASTDKDCKNRTMCGWERYGKIHICVDLMQDPTISCSLPGCTLLHEAGHAVGGVGNDSPPKYKHPEAHAIVKCAGCPAPPHRSGITARLLTFESNVGAEYAKPNP